MLKFSLKPFAIAGLLAAPAALMGQATVQGQASAQVVQALNIVQQTAMSFGNLSVDAGAGGTLTLDSNGHRVPAGGVHVLAGGNPAAGVFDVTGAAAANFTVTMAAPGFAINRAGGGQMQVAVTGVAFDNDVAGTYPLNGAWGAMTAAGNNTIRLESVLTVGANQAPGLYQGTYDITVTYF